MDRLELLTMLGGVMGGLRLQRHHNLIKCLLTLYMHYPKMR